MNGFIKKIKTIDKLQNQVDDHIWTIFHRYIEANKINFNSPYGWEVEDDNIYVHGSDGCMGCYDSMTCLIPLKYFENPDEEFGLLEKKMKDEKRHNNKIKKQKKKRKEIKELKRLTEKYSLDQK
jgi:hypothetical protein